MTIHSDVLTKNILLAWLEEVPEDAPIGLELNEPFMIDFVVVSPNGQKRIFRMGITGPTDDDEEIDPETNEQEH